MRRVHDICPTTMGKTTMYVSFIQHGTREEGFIYENVCPYCATTIEKVTAHPDAEQETVLNRLLQGLVRHYQFCVRRGHSGLQVERTTTPMQTEKLIH